MLMSAFLSLLEQHSEGTIEDMNANCFMGVDQRTAKEPNKREYAEVTV